MIKPHEEFLTVSPNKRTQVRIQLPEKYLADVQTGMKGKIEELTHTGQKLEALPRRRSKRFRSTPDFMT